MQNTDNSRPGIEGMLKGNLMIFVATLFFGINIPVVKMLIPQWMTAMDVTVFRLMGGCLLMWLASTFIKTTPIRRGDWLPIILGGAVGIFTFIFLFNISLHYGDPIDVSIIMTLPPVFVILIGVIFQHRRISLLEILGVIVAFAGAAVVIISQHGDPHAANNRLLGDLFALASAVCYSFYLVIIEKPSKTYRPVSLLRWVFFFRIHPGAGASSRFPTCRNLSPCGRCQAVAAHRIRDFLPDIPRLFSFVACD